jgi:hypothetical protein
MPSCYKGTYGSIIKKFIYVCVYPKLIIYCYLNPILCTGEGAWEHGFSSKKINIYFNLNYL